MYADLQQKYQWKFSWKSKKIVIRINTSYEKIYRAEYFLASNLLLE